MSAAAERDLVAGADPGARGAVALLYPDGQVARVLRLDEHTLAEVCAALRTLRPRVAVAYLERVGAMPKQGVASTFKFGRSVGELRGVLTALELPWREVTPGAWQRRLGCLSGGRKRVTRARAQRQWPDGYVDPDGRRRRVTDAVADALLIAEYARLEALRERLI